MEAGAFQFGCILGPKGLICHSDGFSVLAVDKQGSNYVAIL